MRRTLDIALNELRIIFQDPGIWINLVVVPLVITFAVSFATGGLNTTSEGINYINVDVIDYDQTALSADLQQRLVEANEVLRLCVDATTSDEACNLEDQPLTLALARERLEDSATGAIIEIPAGFENGVDQGEEVELTFISNTNAATPSLTLQALQTAITYITSIYTTVNVSENVIDDISFLTFEDEAERADFINNIRIQAETLWQEPLITLSESSPEVNGEQVNMGFAQSVPGIGSMYVLFAVTPLVTAILRDRKLWTLQRLMTMPLSRAEILGGKLLGYFVVGVIQLAIIFGFGYLMGLRYGSDPLALILTMIAYIFAVTGLSLFLSTIVKNETQASSITLLATLTLAPLGGAWWPLEIVPSWMRTVGHISPIAWAMDAYGALIYRDAGLAGVIIPVIALLIMAVIFFVIGIKRFKFE